ncbi:hypothetical protein OPU71_09195 [Niveibacterium sp. 24ML]|uniref:hypothetical protein n=1 Tax=Niveibacterium sp. 24ML TaxID=2985512 RepID=UPI00226F5D6C|nr:hypothetical protein [Niveibacterium sp. 24ML]MCX9156294.1 hypothetical protein [Niveibacterium sp. 24ML]
MRITFAALLTLTLAACATTPEPAPAAKPAPAPAPAAKPAEAPKPAPQCYNGDTSAFVAVGTKAEVAGVKVECKLAGDGKSAVWQGAK